MSVGSCASACSLHFLAIAFCRGCRNHQETDVTLGLIQKFVALSWCDFDSRTTNHFMHDSFDFQCGFALENIEKLAGYSVKMSHLLASRRNSFFDDA